MSRFFRQTTLQCAECGAEVTILRRACKPKKAGHVKHMWCYRSRKVTVHVEGKEIG